MFEQKTVSDHHYNFLISEVRNEMGLMDDIPDEQVESLIESALKKMTQTSYLPLRTRLHLKEKVFNALRRLDILQPLVDDKSITEIMVNGVKDIFIERSGHVTRLDYTFNSQEQLENIIQMIVSKVNRVVNESSPICDARLADGSRISELGKHFTRSRYGTPNTCKS